MSTNINLKKERVIVYIDGFNLYFGLKSKGWKKFYWLNLQLLAQNILLPKQELKAIKYFTSRISFPPDKVKRQGTFIEALETLGSIYLFYGNYQSNSKQCLKCGNIEEIPSEKMTDVNIAVEMISDSYEDNFETAILVTADSDLVPVIRTIHRLFKKKRIVVAFPPGRFSFALKKIADASFTIGRKTLANSLLPNEVRKDDGFILKRPIRWQ